jgi:YidC/Oxa1 family membrane protein insertase
VIAANPLSGPFQILLDAIGAVLAFLYDVVPSYGIGIILLTLLLRILLIPLAVKQIRSMQSMQSVQPKIKAIQQKFKGDRQRISEETMKLYREHGVNPLGGCLPVLAQFPLLIALYGVLVVPQGLPHIRGTTDPRPPGDPQTTRLYRDITQDGQASGVDFLGMNLICSASLAGSGPQTEPDQRIPVSPAAPRDPDDRSKIDPRYLFTRDCGGPVSRVPAYLFLAAMVASTYYSQRQMQRASPTVNPQQQMLTRIMPLFFGFIGFNFPSGLVVYWTVTNVVQIVQQRYMLPRYTAEAPAGKGTDGVAKKPLSDGGKRPPSGQGRSGQGSAKKPATGGSGSAGSQRPRQGGTKGSGPSTRGQQGGGGRNGGDRKKRRKR